MRCSRTASACTTILLGRRARGPQGRIHKWHVVDAGSSVMPLAAKYAIRDGAAAVGSAVSFGGGQSYPGSVDLRGANHRPGPPIVATSALQRTSLASYAAGNALGPAGVCRYVSLGPVAICCASGESVYQYFLPVQDSISVSCGPERRVLPGEVL